MSAFDTKTKILTLLALIGVLIAIYFSYQRTMIRRDFEVFDSEAEAGETLEPGEAFPMQTETEIEIPQEATTTASTSVNI